MNSIHPRGRSATIAVLLSFLWPGLGQAYQRRHRIALVYALPMIAVAAYVVLLLATRGLQDMALDLFDPSYAQTILVLGLLLGAWRLIAMVDAWMFARRSGSNAALAAGLLAVLGIAVVGAHGYVSYLSWSFYDASSHIFVDSGGGDLPFPDLEASPGGSPGASPDPLAPVAPVETPATESSRITVLLTGIDSTPTRTHALTDTLLVVSVDPASKTGVMASIPRDLGGFRLSTGGTYNGKINSLLSYARSNPGAFPDGPTATLVKEVGHLVGVPVHYYAAVNLLGFVKLVDLVGGVTVNNPRAIDDPRYGGWTDGRPVGFHLPAGRRKLDGQEALAFARSRMGAGDSDFTRARRQQLLLLALQKKMTSPEMLPKLPEILAAAGDTIKTNFPASRLSEMIDLAAQVDDDDIERVVLGPPYTKRSSNPNTYMLIPDAGRFRRVSVRLFGEDSRFYTPPPVATPTPAP